MDMLIIFKVYLIYGLAFFAMFFSIIFRDLRKSRIHIAALLPVFALFGLIHGIHEWSDLYLVMYQHELDLTDNFGTFKAFKLWFSLVFLGVFAWKMLDLTSWNHLRWIKVSVIVVLSVFILGLFIRYDPASCQTYLDETRQQIRWIFALGGGVLSGSAVYSYARILEDEGYGASLPFKLTGIALIGYGSAAGLFSVEMGLWVLILRTVLAVCVTVALWYALRVFDRERESQAESVLQQLHQDAKLKELGELTSAVAHEIKTPISSAMVSCDLLARQLPDDEDLQRQVNRIISSLTRAAEISHEVLNYAHHKPIQRKKVLLNEVIRDAVQLNQYRLNEFGLTVECDESLFVRGDAGLLEEVVSNLISNAIDASRETKVIQITCFRDKLHAVIRISDQGEGMPPHLIEKATQPFFTTKPKGEGTGMGLSLCKQIVLRHSGELVLRNHNKGFTAEIRIPRENE